jgi:hypothetical protein
MLRCLGDYSFGPVLGTAFPFPDSEGFDSCYNFDFTLVFEESIFSIAPCAILLLFTIWRIAQLYRRPNIVSWPWMRALKLVR